MMLVIGSFFYAPLCSVAENKLKSTFLQITFHIALVV